MGVVSRASRMAASVMATVIAVATLSGCAPRVLESADGLIVPLAAEGNGMEALIVGELTTSPGGCLAVRSEEGASLTLLASAPGTTLDGEGAVVMPVYGRLMLGEQVSLGGGGGAVDEWSDRVELPEACGDVADIFFVNSFG